MAEQLLQVAQVGAGIEPMVREGVAQPVRARPPLAGRAGLTVGRGACQQQDHHDREPDGPQTPVLTHARLLCRVNVVALGGVQESDARRPV